MFRILASVEDKPSLQPGRFISKLYYRQNLLASSLARCSAAFSPSLAPISRTSKSPILGRPGDGHRLRAGSDMMSGKSGQAQLCTLWQATSIQASLAQTNATRGFPEETHLQLSDEFGLWRLLKFARASAPTPTQISEITILEWVPDYDSRPVRGSSSCKVFFDC